MAERVNEVIPVYFYKTKQNKKLIPSRPFPPELSSAFKGLTTKYYSEVRTSTYESKGEDLKFI